MIKSKLFYLFLVSLLSSKIFGTYSIVAVDSVTGEVGSAGASCVDYVSFNLVAGRIGDLIPGIGAINTQAATNLNNQANARTRMLAGDNPTQILEWLQLNDVDGDSTSRQYGIVDFNQGNPRSAAYTGRNCSDYKSHILGPNYSIQGNIILSQSIFDSMESNFKSEQGSLACKLMSAIQGAKQVGADTRCASNGTSALYAYVKVAKTTDQIDNPSFFLGVKTRRGARIEPVDSLQSLFDNSETCNVGVSPLLNKNVLSLHSLIINNILNIRCMNCDIQSGHLVINNIKGQIIFHSKFINSMNINTSFWEKGVYIIHARIKGTRYTKKIIVE